MSKLEAVQRTRELYAGLNGFVMEWDPYGLSRAGEIDDEFSNEVWSLLTLLCAVRTPEDTVRAVEQVFAGWFSPQEFTYEFCQGVGKRIHRWWCEQE